MAGCKLHSVKMCRIQRRLSALRALILHCCHKRPDLSIYNLLTLHVAYLAWSPLSQRTPRKCFPQMPGIFRRLVALADQSLSLMRFNLWRRRSFEPASRAIARGTIFMVALLILLGYTVYTISRGLNVSTMYGRRSFRRTGFAGITPQPHLFTNHCTSAMLPGGVSLRLNSMFAYTEFPLKCISRTRMLSQG